MEKLRMAPISQHSLRSDVSVGEVLQRIDGLTTRLAGARSHAIYLFFVWVCAEGQVVTFHLGGWTSFAVLTLAAVTAMWGFNRYARRVLGHIADLALAVAPRDDVRVLPALGTLYYLSPSAAIAGALAVAIERRPGRELTAADRRVLAALRAQQQRIRCPELEAALRMGLSSDRTLEFPAVKNPAVIPPRHQI